MNIFTDATLFAVVLAINLLLIGAILAGGIALVFKFTESVAPRVRYVAAVVIFLTAVLFPFSAATERENDAIKQKETAQTAADSEPKKDSGNRMPLKNLDSRQEINFGQAVSEKKSSANFMSDFIARSGDSFHGKIFLSIWLLGFILLIVREIIGLRQLKKERADWTLATDAERENLQCPVTTRLYFAANQTPGTIGLFRPVIVLPKEFPDEISLESKRFIVRHELAHARRFDPLVGFLVRAIRNLFWISPALWLLEKLIDAEREAAADRTAIGSLSNEKSSENFALDYAETLILLANSLNSGKTTKRQAQLIGINSGSDLEIRIRRLLLSERFSFRQAAYAFSACLLTGAVIAVIPLAAFSGLNRKNHLNFVSAEDNQKILSDENETSAELFQGENVVLTQAEVNGKEKSQQPKDIRLNKSVIENPVSSEPNSTGKMQRVENRILDFAVEDDAEVSAKILSENDAAAADLKENQRAAEKLSDPEMLTAARSLTDELNALQRIRPASGLKTVLPDEDELSRQKAASELDRRRNYPPPAVAVPKRETYESKYVPYQARRSGQ